MSLYEPVHAKLDFLDRYPHLSKAAQEASSLITLPREDQAAAFPNGSFELEARFGCRGAKGEFVTGVSKDFMSRCIAKCREFRQWSGETNWEDRTDYFYVSGDGPLMRTTVTTANNEICTTHIKKHVRGKIDFTGASYEIRVSMNFEENVPTSDMPKFVKPSLVRIKSRKRFLYGSKDGEAPLWAYDFTRSWTDSTKIGAEAKQANDDTSYEIEIECLDPTRYMAQHGQGPVFVTTSLLLKMVDFLSNETFTLR